MVKIQSPLPNIKFGVQGHHEQAINSGESQVPEYLGFFGHKLFYVA